MQLEFDVLWQRRVTRNSTAQNRKHRDEILSYNLSITRRIHTSCKMGTPRYAMFFIMALKTTETNSRLTKYVLY